MDTTAARTAAHDAERTAATLRSAGDPVAARVHDAEAAAHHDAADRLALITPEATPTLLGLTDALVDTYDLEAEYLSPAQAVNAYRNVMATPPAGQGLIELTITNTEGDGQTLSLTPQDARALAAWITAHTF